MLTLPCFQEAGLIKEGLRCMAHITLLENAGSSLWETDADMVRKQPPVMIPAMEVTSPVITGSVAHVGRLYRGAIKEKWFQPCYV